MENDTRMEIKYDLENIDFKTITAEVVKEISEMPLEQPGGFFSRRPVKINVTQEMVREMLLRKVWGKSIELLNKLYAKKEPLVAEKALSELIKRDVVKEKIIYKKDSFRLKLENGEYRAYTFGSSETVYACPWPSEKRYEIRIPGGLFAEFILRFDAEIPEIITHVPEIIQSIRAREMAEKKDEIERELKEKVLQALIDQYLKPLGLTVHSTMKEGDMVSMDIQQVKSAHLEMPLWQLLEKLKDTGAILDSLQPEPAENEFVDFDDLGIIP